LHNENEIIEEMGLWQRFLGIITRPGATLAAVVEKPAILWPALVISLVNLGLFIVTAPKFKEFMLWQFENMPQQLPAEEMARMKSLMSGGAVIGAGVSMVVMPFVIWLVLALLFKFLNLFIGNEAPMKKLYAVAVISGVPAVLGTALRSVLVLLSPAENYAAVTTSAAAALPKGAAGPLFAVMSAVDPFIIWSLALMALGGAMVLKTSVRKTGIMVFVIWVLLAAVSVVGALLNPQAMPGV
jgi:hypothetical protein